MYCIATHFFNTKNYQTAAYSVILQLQQIYIEALVIRFLYIAETTSERNTRRLEVW